MSLPQVDDVQITAQVKSELAADVGLSIVTNVPVNSTNGIVTLAGQVDSAEIKTKAEAAAGAFRKWFAWSTTYRWLPRLCREEISSL